MLFVDSTLSPSQQTTAKAALLTATFVTGIFALIGSAVVQLLHLERRVMP